MNKYLCLLYLFFCCSASAECAYRAPEISIRLDPGKVKYVNYMAREEYAKETGLNLPKNNLGLTTSRVALSYKTYPFQGRDGNKICLGLRRVIFSIGADTIYVFIDKKYRPGTCEYKAIKEHENYHVAVTQQALRFFKADIEKALNKAVKKVRPEYVYSTENAESVLQHQMNQVVKEMQPLMDHINHKIEEKNAAIDTPESYKSTSALCKNW